MLNRSSDLLRAQTATSSAIAVFIVLSLFGFCQAETPSAEEPSRAVSPGTFAIGLYQDYVSPIDASSCQMWPSCSLYARQSFQKHGFIMGVLLTSDRLMRCNFAARSLYPPKLLGERVLCADPLHMNTWWWKKRESYTDAAREE